MKVGDRVQNIHHPEETGTVVRIKYEYPPYCVMVQVDGRPKYMNNGMGNFKESDLRVIKNELL